MNKWFNTQFVICLPDADQADYLHFDIEHTMAALKGTAAGVSASDFAAEARLDDFLISDDKDLGLFGLVELDGNKVVINAYAPWGNQLSMWRAFVDKYYSDIPVGFICKGVKTGDSSDEERQDGLYRSRKALNEVGMTECNL